MKINRILSAFCLAALLSGCEDIKEADRYVQMEAVVPVRAVLIEEFTGQACQNCPEGHKIVEALREQYGSAVIPVSIHSSNLAYADGALGTQYQGLKTDEGETYYKNSGAQSLPSAVIDRCSGALGRAQWADIVDEELEKPSPATINIEAEYEDGMIDIDVDVISTQNLDCTLQVWVVESGIISYQLDGRNRIYDYEHNHVFRSSVNGTDGEDFAINANVFFEKEYKMAVGEKWVPENLSIVAFIYDSSGVLQAAEAHVATSAE